MKTLYAIRDRIAQDLVSMQMYNVFAFKTDQQAARYFADCINEKTSILHAHPADYELIAIAQIKDTGHLLALTEPQIIITGDGVLALQSEQPKLVREA